MTTEEKVKLLHTLSELLQRQSKVVLSMEVNEDAPVWDSKWATELQTRYNDLSEQILAIKKEVGLQ
jgi:hypothetical protein